MDVGFGVEHGWQGVRPNSFKLSWFGRLEGLKEGWGSDI
jgi:hypothetical protein